MLIKINVTAEDIRDGKPRSKCDCPIALAIGRNMALQGDAQVTHAHVRLPGGTTYELPPIAQGFIAEFDNSDRSLDFLPLPFSFELEVRDPLPEEL